MQTSAVWFLRGKIISQDSSFIRREDSCHPSSLRLSPEWKRPVENLVFVGGRAVAGHSARAALARPGGQLSGTGAALLGKAGWTWGGVQVLASSR